MKRKLLTLCVSILCSTFAFAQLPNGSLAPNFTYKDLNGNTQDLYAILASGKTVFIDVSAAWCAPCWAYHNARHLDSLWMLHGPAGQPVVSATTTNDVMVLFIEGEGTNTRAQTLGTSTGTTHANFTQGNWTLNTDYPIIDTNLAESNAFDAAWQIGYFPTIYCVCRDRFVYEAGQSDMPTLYSYVTNPCPTYAQSSTIDAKIASYTGNDYFVCNANPTVKFQNYSATNNITSATIKVYSGATLMATVPWTGNLAPLAVASVPVPAFAATNFMPYKYTVTVSGDSNPANDNSADSLFVVYAAANAGTIPATESWGSFNLPVKYSFSNDGTVFPTYGTSSTHATGPNGSTDTALLFDFYDNSTGGFEFVLGNFNTTGSSSLNLQFDLAAAQYNATSTDKLEVLVNTNCSANWTSVWSAQGAALATAPIASTLYIPSAASQWAHKTISLSSYQDANMVVKFKGTSNYGNNAWVDNINLSNTLAVGNNAVKNNNINLFPNPANEKATLNIALTETTNVNVTVIDIMGRTVFAADKTLAAGTIEIPTANFSTGMYSVKVQTGKDVTTLQLSVIK